MVIGCVHTMIACSQKLEASVPIISQIPDWNPLVYPLSKLIICFPAPLQRSAVMIYAKTLCHVINAEFQEKLTSMKP